MSDSTKYSSKLRDSRILIIGGSSGIGFCVAEACLEAGAIVTISSSNKDRVAKAIERLQTSYPSAKAKVHGVQVNLADAETVENELTGMLDRTKEKNEGKMLDHVVFTAGDALALIPLGEMTMPKILAAGQTRFFAPLLLAKHLPSYLNRSYKSSYIVTTGAVSERPMPNWSVVAAYSGGHHSMVRNLAVDMKPIRVNGVSPGAVQTELWGNDVEKIMKEQGQEFLTGRPGYPEDVAESYMVCLRDANMTGGMVRTDGGQLLI